LLVLLAPLIEIADAMENPVWPEKGPLHLTSIIEGENVIVHALGPKEFLHLDRFDAWALPVETLHNHTRSFAKWN
jgi:hypothetical protein